MSEFSERVKEINKRYPEVTQLNWRNVFKADPKFMGEVINDVMRKDMAAPSRPGKRSPVPVEQAKQRFKEYANEDFSMLPAPEILKILQGDLSIRQFGDKCGIHYTRLYKIMTNKSTMSIEDMERVAVAHNKKPAFFLEYRIAYICSSLTEALVTYPESSVVQYKKLVKM